MTPYSVMLENVTRSILSIRGKEKIDKKTPEKHGTFLAFLASTYTTHKRRSR